jgi:transposase InsO family protein
MVPCSSKITAKGIAELFLDHIWKRHGFPEKTISDRGPIFNNKYLKALYERLGIKAHFSSAYHPQTNSQTEWMNPGIEQFLRAYAGMYQKDWVKWLPMTEFSYNNAIHSATGTSPFRCLYGRDPVMTPSKVPTDLPEANRTADTLQEIWDETKAALNLAKERMAGREPGEVPNTFEVRERVWLDSWNLRLKTNSPKLTDRCLGPFEVSERLSDRAYRLKLLENLKIHNVFYVGLLSKVKEDCVRPIVREPGPLEVEGEEEYDMEEIVDSEQRPNGWYYRINWTGYGPESNTWEPKANLEHAEDILKKYHQKLLRKACDAAKSLKGGAVL